jgi:hypothetical protein
VSQPVDAAGVQKWQQVLTPEEMALVEVKVGGLLDEFGYARLPDLPAVPEDLSSRYDELSRSHRSALKPLRSAAARAPYSKRVAAKLTTAQRRQARGLRKSLIG